MGLLIIYFLTTSNLLKTVSTLTIKQTVVNNDIINIVIFPDLDMHFSRIGNKTKYFFALLPMYYIM